KATPLYIDIHALQFFYDQEAPQSVMEKFTGQKFIPKKGIALESSKTNTAFLFLLPSRLYCRLWNFTKSTGFIYKPGCGLRGYTSSPPVGNCTLPRRKKLFD